MTRCSVHGCGIPMPCPTHKHRRPRPAYSRAPRTDRDAAHNAFLNSHTWRQCSKAFLARFQICGQRADGRVYTEHSRCAQDGRFNSDDIVVDHIIPVSRGGARFAEANQQVLCRTCNSAKNNRVIGTSGVREGAHDVVVA